ncbi:hypothetical protein G6F35_014408 [Rhizopus arrhizus]|nr:hypothetical protein G6F35_014408 [Rhizopus arrhizus]
MARHGQQRFDAGQHALGIVRQHHDVVVGQMAGQRGIHAVQRGLLGMLFEIHAQQLLLAAQHAQVDTLSMGMSGDYADAIAEGATLVRIGTALFGARPRPA